jgi:hypothetical protein
MTIDVQLKQGTGGGAAPSVTLVLPMAAAKDLLVALNLALGGGGGKKRW